MFQEQQGSDSMYDSDYNDAASDLVAPEKPPVEEPENERPDSAEVDGEWGMLNDKQKINKLALLLLQSSKVFYFINK